MNTCEAPTTNRRQRRRRWACVLCVITVFVVPMSAAVATAQRHSATIAAQPMARTAAVPAVATGIVTELLKGALNKTGSEGFGWLLGQFGIGTGIDSDVAKIQEQLAGITAKVNELLAATQALRSELALSSFSGLVGQATPIVARIDKGVNDLESVARMSANDPGKKALAQETLKYIGEKLMGGEQEELAKRISGEAGADGLVVAASRVERAQVKCCWSNVSTAHVDRVFDYYRWAETRLLLLRVEYMHAYPDRFPGSYVEEQIKRVQSDLTAQQTLLKPSPGATIFADPRTKLNWEYKSFGSRTSATNARRVASAHTSSGWRLPSASEVTSMLAGWPGGNWGNWLNGQLGGQLYTANFSGVWTNAERIETISTGKGKIKRVSITTAVLSDGQVQEQRNPAQLMGILLVKDRGSATYWW